MKNPYLSAAAASAYIGMIVLLITAFGRFDLPEQLVIIPVMMLSLLTLSVALMALLFFYRPLALFLDGKRAEALAHFARTLGTFTLLTVLLVVAYVATATLTA